MAQAAHDLGTENVLVVPGAVHIPWRDDHEPVRNDVCDRRAREAGGTLVKTAEKLKVYLNIENIFFNGYCTFEYFHPYAHYPEALVYQTSDSLDRILGRK